MPLLSLFSNRESAFIASTSQLHSLPNARRPPPPLAKHSYAISYLNYETLQDPDNELNEAATEFTRLDWIIKKGDRIDAQYIRRMTTAIAVQRAGLKLEIRIYTPRDEEQEELPTLMGPECVEVAAKDVVISKDMFQRAPRIARALYALRFYSTQDELCCDLEILDCRTSSVSVQFIARFPK